MVTWNLLKHHSWVHTHTIYLQWNETRITSLTVKTKYFRSRINPRDCVQFSSSHCRYPSKLLQKRSTNIDGMTATTCSSHFFSTYYLFILFICKVEGFKIVPNFQCLQLASIRRNLLLQCFIFTIENTILSSIQIFCSWRTNVTNKLLKLLSLSRNSRKQI